MADESRLPELSEAVVQWTERQRRYYIDTGGVKGHIEDTRPYGGRRFTTMLLVRYQGRKTGRTRIISLGYCQIGPELAIVASMGGADVHPQWYHNILAGGPLAIQVGTQAFEATWREAAGDELEEAWAFVTRANPMFAGYRQRTTRAIPILLLTPGEEIPVFTRADIAKP